MTDLATTGWQRFDVDPELNAWLERAAPAALSTARDPGLIRDWLRCDGTWFAGVNVLDNDQTGAVAGSGPLRGQAVTAARALFGPLPWDRAQVSVVYPGYPRPQDGESPANFRYRRDRDAAHVDGLLPIGPERRRMIREPHAFILGLPLTETSPGAAPLVVWEGSHRILRQAFAEALAGHDPATWRDVDVTEVYQAARRHIFGTCPRVALHARPGEAYLLHRLALHGVAPFEPAASAPADGRAIAYFRPAMPGTVADWLQAD